MRNCIIIVNSSNFVGTLNHSVKKADGSYEKLRVDYKDLLQYLVGPDRTLLAAYMVSQQDMTNTTRSLEQLQSNQRFVQKLTQFGWTPLRIAYDRATGNMDAVLDAIWQNVMAPISDENGLLTINQNLTDVIFVNGSSSWYDIISGFFTTGFSVEIAYPKIATSRILMANFAFFDITPFLMANNAKVSEKNNKDAND